MSVAAFQEQASALLDEIARLLKPDAKISFIARFPGKPEQDILMTQDDPAEVVGLIQRRMKAGTT